MVFAVQSSSASFSSHQLQLSNGRVQAIGYADGRIRGLVVELSNADPDVHGALASVAGVPLLVRMRRPADAARRLGQLACACHALSVSVIGVDELAEGITALSNTNQSADKHLLERVARFGAGGVHDILIAAVVIARRRAEVRQLATWCRIPIRTLEWRLNAARVIPARRVLGVMLSLHALWQIDVLELPLKAVAQRMRFGSSGALANYVSRHAGGRPRALLEQGSFWRCLEQLRLRQP